MVKTLVARSSQALRKIADQLVPHLRNVHVISADASNGLDVGCDTLFDPVVFFGHRGKRQMNHLVREHPIRSESLLIRIRANMDRDQPASPSESHAMTDAAPLGGSDAKQEPGDGKMAVVAGDRLRGRMDPIAEIVLREVEASAFDDDVEAGSADQNG